MVVIGHVDAGKSTLMGQLLLHAGQVEERTMRKYEKESLQLGKASFKFAWVMDQSEEERTRGVTVDVGTAFFHSGSRAVNVLDAPGHRDFVPNMIGGAAQADLALLVINAKTGEFESGLSGQCKEHIVLARSLGISRLVIAVNQMDSVGWARERFESIAAGLAPILANVGYKTPPPPLVPVSALHGFNLIPNTRPSAGLDWYKGNSLLEEIDAVEPVHRASTVGTRFAASDVFKPATGALGTLTLAGTVQAGTITLGERLLLLPSQSEVVVKALQSRGQSVSSVTAGDHCEAGIVPAAGAAGAAFDPTAISAGSVLCDPLRPVAFATRLEVQLRTLGAFLTKGQPFELYAHSASCAATLRKIVAAIDKKTGERLPEAPKPRRLLPGMAAIVQLDLDRPMAVEAAADCRHLGRVILRDSGKTVAAGLVLNVVAKKRGSKVRDKTGQS